MDFEWPNGSALARLQCVPARICNREGRTVGFDAGECVVDRLGAFEVKVGAGEVGFHLLDALFQCFDLARQRSQRARFL